MSALFTPLRVGALELTNRIVIRADVPILGRQWLHDRLAPDSPRPSGAALLTIEATAVLPEGRITCANVGFWNEATEAAIART